MQYTTYSICPSYSSWVGANDMRSFSSRDGGDWTRQEEAVGLDDAAYALLMEGI
jgi:hypothetical protein